MDHPVPSSPLVSAGPHCAHLRHKGMYVLAGAEASPNEFYDSYDATAFWCTRTQKAVGPDGHPVHADVCRGGRACCSDL